VNTVLRHPELGEGMVAIDMYDLPDAGLSPFAGLMVPITVDQELLFRERDRIRAFLDRGRVLVFSGHLLRPWLPGAGLFVPRVIRSYHDYALRIVAPHPIFAGVTEHDLTYRRGVAGFFARGHNPPPAHAEVLVTLPGGEPVVYVDRQSTGGVILAHSGNDLLTYGIGDDTTATRIAPQLLAWIRTEASR
jgi:hypothetical protein